MMKLGLRNVGMTGVLQGVGDAFTIPQVQLLVPTLPSVSLW